MAEQMIAEFVGTFALIFIGAGSVVIFTGLTTSTGATGGGK